MNGTGPFKMVSYAAKQGASFERNPDYWGGAPLLDRVEFSFYADYQPQILALLGKEIDVVQHIPVLQAASACRTPISPSSARRHPRISRCMRTDIAPFTDKRVRRAIALCLDRPTGAGPDAGLAEIGNDTPFMPAYPSTDETVAQRDIDIAAAEELMAAAGMPDGFEITLTTEKYLEIPDYAEVIQNAVREIGGRITLNVLDQGAYYGDAVSGKSPGSIRHGHHRLRASRGAERPSAAPLLSDGTWNWAHFNNTEYDRAGHRLCRLAGS